MMPGRSSRRPVTMPGWGRSFQVGARPSPLPGWIASISGIIGYTVVGKEVPTVVAAPVPDAIVTIVQVLTVVAVEAVAPRADAILVKIPEVPEIRDPEVPANPEVPEIRDPEEIRAIREIRWYITWKKDPLRSSRITMAGLIPSRNIKR